MFWVLCVTMVSLSQAVPLPEAGQEGEEVGPLQAESKGNEETNSLKELAVELKESTVFPLLLNPFQITKLTCGSLITFYDSQQEDATVVVDVCLTALIIAKMVAVLPAILGEVDVARMQGGLVGLLDRVGEAMAAARLQLAARAGEEAVDKVNLGGERPKKEATTAGFEEAEGYFGFGFDGWSSGIHEFPQFNEESLVEGDGFLKRQFPELPVSGLEALLATTLHQLEGAVTIAG